MASPYGPWASPPPCNKTSDCAALLQATSSVPVGNAVCYEELLPAGLQPGEALGGCACESMYALGGEICKSLTDASPSAIACEIIVALVCTLVVARYSVTLVGICRQRGIWKMNAAGTSYAITWLALILAWFHSLMMVVLVFHVSSGSQLATRILNRVMIILLSIAVLNLVAAFIEMSSSVRLIQNIEKSRVPVGVTIVISSVLIIMTYLFAKPIISAGIGLVVVLALAIFGITGPIIM